jgi:hypothetical protein
MEYRSWIGGNYGPPLASITRCDLGQMFELNLADGQYETAPYPPKPLTKEQREALGLKMPQFTTSGNPTLRIETTTVDTGERKDFFGHAARHVITTRKQIPLEGSKSDAQRTVNDGWYIDLDTNISCDPGMPMSADTRAHPRAVHAFLAAGGMPVEKMEFVDEGQPETGFAIQMKMTSTDASTRPDGTKKEHISVNEMQVAQFVEGPLDPGLFTIPNGFRKVEHIERNPPANPLNTWSVAWEQFKARVARFFQ